MKKIVCMFLCLTLLLQTAGCKSETEVMSVSEEVQKLGAAVVEVTDDYLDGNITGDEAKEKIESYYSDVCAICDKEEEDRALNPLDYGVEFDVSMVSISVRALNKGTETTTTVIKDRNELAKAVGLEER